jgi:hypothetical protein
MSGEMILMGIEIVFIGTAGILIIETTGRLLIEEGTLLRRARTLLIGE